MSKELKLYTAKVNDTKYHYYGNDEFSIVRYREGDKVGIRVINTKTKERIKIPIEIINDLINNG